MTEHRPHTATKRDYIPAFGKDALLPFYDLLTRVLGMGRNYDALIAQAELADSLRVLEIGCGTGNVTVRAKRAALGADVVGTDPDPLALARAQRKARGLPGIRFERAYAQELPFVDGEFDRALSSMMLHHLDEDVKTGALAELHRVLRPGGRLHIVDIGGHTTVHHGLAARWMKDNPHAAGNLGDAIPQLLRKVGFECEEVGTRRHRLIGQLTFYRATRPG
ncbi:class I SAM-dependent methyltransferase [Mycobacterium sp.]|uniref:class I SAM-dependent methyltransferase n=1 Tax=Mycobacterium sp. TaxID=1785 RepID=UPI002CBE3013|nr:class I SAM-dependent methyltransferase [Mycobacterium sp.]HKP43538.1 class I SAM-dependent methyltransferase [Mycobacterium sp.]